MTTFIDPAAIDRSRGWKVGASTGVFFADGEVGPGKTPFAPIRSLRGFFGDAMDFTGGTAGNNENRVPQLIDPAVFDGAKTLEYYAINAALLSATDYGIAAAFAATTKNAVENDQTIAVAAHAANYDAQGKAWSFYADTVRMPGMGTSWVAEFQLANLGPSPTAGDGAPGTTPFGRFPHGSTRVLTIGSGADPEVHTSAYPVDVGILFSANGSTFWNGITFGPGSLEPWADTKRRAMNMAANGTRISWWTQGPVLDDGNPMEQFWIEANYSGSAAASRQGMRANNSGITFVNDIGAPFFFLNNGPDTQNVNYVSIASAAAGNPGRVYVDGPDTNIGLRLEGKGTGKIVIGSVMNVNGFPTSAAGLSAGDVYLNSGVLTAA
ncbi:hypothetical protein [Pseudooceanicola sp.]|uniref:hypothetical protein n=1 Tax=Pseudooceanicola sp. TaxID=1914328 RepID=UPI0040587947